MAAPAFRAAGTVVSSADGTLSVPLPSGYQIGDLLLAFWESKYGIAAINGATLGNGWTAVSLAGANNAYLKAAYKFAASTSETAPALTVYAGDPTVALAHAYSGASPSDGLTLLGSATGYSGSPSISSGSTTKADALVLIAVARASLYAEASGWSNANLTSLTERTEAGELYIGIIGVATGVKATAGSLGTTTLSLSEPTNWAARLIALYPGAPPISGTGSPALANVTASGAGALALSGSASKTLGAVTSSAAGSLSLSGQGGAHVGPFIPTATGALSLTGAASIALAPIAASGEAALWVAGQASIFLGEVVATGTGTLSLPGGWIGDILLGGAGGLAIAGEGALAISNIAAAGEAFITSIGMGDVYLGEVVASGEGTLSLSGEATAYMGGIVSAGAGTLSISGAGWAAIAPFVLAARGGEPVLAVTSPGRVLSLAASQSAARALWLTPSRLASRTLNLKG